RDAADAADILRSLAPPAFVAVTGSLRFDPRLPGTHLVVIPEACRVADRGERDRWLLRTADLTLSRVESLPASPRAEEVALMVEQAIAVVADAPLGAPEGPVREAVFDLIAAGSGPRGVAVDAIVARARDAGYAEGPVRDAIRSLLEDDDCYTPTPGYIKPL
ncbi:MAG: hypothetical protein GKC04_06300, partial [Methanomicrobiales archaeon]|nr:hypothetical protein [Methanomicrobiales archaeon]